MKTIKLSNGAVRKQVYDILKEDYGKTSDPNWFLFDKNLQMHETAGVVRIKTDGFTDLYVVSRRINGKYCINPYPTLRGADTDVSFRIDGRMAYIVLKKDVLDDVTEVRNVFQKISNMRYEDDYADDL